MSNLWDDEPVAPAQQAGNVWDYLEQREAQEEEQKDAHIRALRDVTKSANLDEEATITRLARESGAHPESIRANLPEWKSFATRDDFEPRAFRRDNPALARTLFSRPDLAPLILHDEHMVKFAGEAMDAPKVALHEVEEGIFAKGIRAIGAFVRDRQRGGEDLAEYGLARRRARPEKPAEPTKALMVEDLDASGWEAVKARWMRTRTGAERNKVGFQLLRAAGEPDQELEQRLVAVEQEMGLPRHHGFGWAGQTALDVVEGVASTTSALEGMGAGAIVGGALGATAGAIGGAFAGPLGSLQLATAGAAAGVKAGALIGGAVVSLELEAGGAYLTYREMEVDGRKIDDDEARGAAMAYGALAAIVETGANKVLLKNALPESLLAQFAAGESKALALQWLKDRSLRSALKDIGRRMAKTGGAEGFEEAAQSALENVIGYATRSKSAGALQEADFVEGLAEAAEAGVKGALTGPVLAAPGGMVDLGMLAVRDSNAQIAERQVRALKDFATTARLAKADPRVAAEFAQRQTAESGKPVDTIYVAPEAVKRLFQEAGVDPDVAARELMGPSGPERMDAALQSGQRLAVPMAEYIERWSPKPAAEKLLKDMTTSAELETPAEMLERKREEQRRFEELVAQIKKGEFEPRGEAEAEVVRVFAEGAKTATVAGKQVKEGDAEHQIAAFRAFVHTMSDRIGKPADELFSRFVVRVQAGDVDAGATTAAAQRLMQPKIATPTVEALQAKLRSLSTPEARAAEIGIDQVSGLRTRRAWDAAKRTPGKLIAAITTPEAKAINDAIEGGHDTTNELLRLIGAEIGKVDPNAARGGTNFLLEVDSEEHLGRVIAGINAKLPDPHINIEGGMGADVDAAFKAMNARVDAKRLKKELPARGAAHPGLNIPALKFEEGKALATVPQEFVDQVGLLSDEAFFKDAFEDSKMPGVLTAIGWRNTPRRKFIASIDMSGLKRANDLFAKATGENALGKKAGDAMLKQFAFAMTQFGGQAYDFAHLSGDEFAMQADMQEDLETFLSFAQARLRDVGVPLTIKGETFQMELGFRFGTAEGTYGAADRELNRRKKAELERAKEGAAADLNRPARGRDEGVGGDAGGHSRRGDRDQRRADVGAGRGADGRGERASRPRSIEEIAAAVEALRLGAGDFKRLFAGPVDKGGGPRGFIDVRQEGERIALNIFLTQQADLSTLLHEMGHAFYEMFAELAALPETPAAVKRDFDVLQTWLGAEGRDLTTPQHEKMARAFERYFMEGKAPSEQLRRPFARFHRWLKNIYRTVARLDVELNPEVRGVFDRMLATDEEIAQARARAGQTPLFRHATEAGLSADEWQEHLDDQEKAFEEAAQSGRFRELQALLKETRKEVERREVEAKASAEAEYAKLRPTRASEAIRSGNIIADDGTVMAEPSGKLDRLEAVQLVGEDLVRAIEKRLGTKRKPQAKEPLVVTPQRPKGERVEYAVIEAAELVPSHDAQSFRPREDYPPGVQEREYHRSQDEQAKVVAGAQALNPALLLADTPSAVDGPPLVTAGERHLVLGGNGRSMMIQRAFADPAVATAYRAELIRKAKAFGVRRAAVDKLKAPVLVRVVPGLTPASPKGELVAAVRRFNEGLTQQLSPRARAVAEARTLTPATIEAFGELLASAEDKSLRDMLSDRGADFVAILARDGIVNAQNRAQWVAGGELTAEAKDRIEGMFLGLVLETGERLAATAPGILQKLERAVPHLIRVAGINPGLDELSTVRAAIDVINDAARRHLKLQDLLNQGEFFGGDKPDARARALVAKLLVDEKQLEVGKRFKAWAVGAAVDPRQGGLFGGPPSRPEVIRRLLGDEDLTGVSKAAAPHAAPSPTSVESREVVYEATDDVAGPWRKATQEGPAAYETAEMLRYGGGAEMLREVATHPAQEEWVAREVERRMRAESAELVAQLDVLSESVDKGTHGDFTAKWLARELEILGRKAGIGGGRTVDELRKAAARIVGRMAVGQLRPDRALRAERSFATKALRAAAKGNYAQAYVFHQKRLLNFYLFREVVQAVEQREAFERLSTDLSKDAARERMGKASPLYRDAVDTTLEALGVSEPRNQPGRPGMEAATAKLEQDGFTILFDTDVLKAVLDEPRPWSELRVVELEAVLGALKQIRKAAIEANKIIVGNRKLEKEEVLASIEAEVEKHSGGKTRKAIDREVATGLEKLQSRLRALDYENLRPEALLEDLVGPDVDSMTYKALMLPIQEAKYREADILKKVIEPINKAFEAMPKVVRARWERRVDGEKAFPGHRANFGRDLPAPSKHFQIVMMAFNVGNEQNKQRLLEGRNIGEEELARALDTLTKEEWDYVQAVLDAMESLWPEIAALEERVNGLAPKKVEATAVSTKFGSYRGGYFPLVYNRDASESAGAKQATTIGEIMDAGFHRPATNHSHTKKRVRQFAAALSLNPAIIQGHLVRVAHDLAYREALQSVARLVMDERFREIVIRHQGAEAVDQYLAWLLAVGAMRGTQLDAQARAMEQFLGEMKGNATSAILGLRADIFLGDAVNVLTASSTLQKKHWAKGLVRFMSDPMAAREEALELSGEMRARSNRLAEELRANLAKVVSGGPVRGAVRVLKDNAFVFFEWSDAAFATPVWWGGYIEGQTDAAKKGMVGDDAKKHAVVFADRMVRKSFPSGSVVDHAAILRSRGWIGRSIAFFGYFSTQFSRYHEITRMFRRSPVAAGIALGIMTSTTALSEIVTRGRANDDDEDFAPWFARKMALSPLLAVPFIGAPTEMAAQSLATGKWQKPSVKASPAFALYESLGRTAYLASRKEVSELALGLALARTVSLLYGLPLEHVLRATRYGVSDERPAATLQEGALRGFYGERRH